MTLAKAQLVEISADDPPRELGAAVPVQFNPTTLRLQLANQVEGGRTRGRQSRQYTGSASTTLTLELQFDTADEGTTDAPVSVREKTAIVEKYVLPRGQGREKQAPPKLRFQWGTLVIDGLVESVDIDFDLFAADGTPLRAKVGLAIKEQDAKYQYLSAGPGANTAGGGADAQQVAPALDGESAADFAQRNGLDPAAWRALGLAGQAALGLLGGVEIGFGAQVGLKLGLGASLGVSAGVGMSLGGSFGIDTGAAAAAPRAASPARPAASASPAGAALAAAGGTTAAIEAVKTVQADTAVRAATSAFGAPPPAGPAPAARPQPPEQARAPLARAGLPGPVSAAPPAPALPAADPRAASFGFGVPLRPRVASGRDHLPPSGDDPTVPRWRALPATRVAGGGRAARPLGHAGGCGCRRCGGH